MTTTVKCSCGVELVVVGKTAGETLECPKCARPIPVPASAPRKDPAPAPKKPSAPAAPETQCVYCGSTVPARAFHCPKCYHQIKADTEPTTVWKSPPGGEAEKAKVPWEVWLVLVFVTVGIAADLRHFDLFLGLGGAVLGSVLFVGLALRSSWGWWLGVVLPILFGALNVYLSFTLDWKLRDDTVLVAAIRAVAGLWLIQILLLVRCRARGAYEKD